MDDDQFHRLIARLAAVGYDVDDDQKPIRLTGGLANLNYRMKANGQPVVLRVAPGGDIPPGAHDMAREHHVLSRLAPVFPLAPRSLHLCEDVSILGAPFQLIEFREGRTVRGEDLSTLPDGEDLRGNLHELLADLLTRFHAVDAQTSGLGGLGRPDGFIPRTASAWSRRGRLVTDGRREAVLVDQTTRWLEDHLPEDTGLPPTLLHCDFKLDNIMLGESDLRPVALLDWDMATRGDPLFDLATLLSYWSQPDDPDCLRDLRQMPTALPGFPGRDDMAMAYERASGRSVRWLGPIRILCLFKLGIVFLQLHQRWVNGALGDDRYASFERLGFDLLEHTLAQANSMKN